MKRRMSGGKPTKIEIIPMIDTMFFLLVFFLLSSLNIINLESLGINLPKEKDKVIKKVDVKDVQLTCSIRADGSVYVNTVLTDPELIGQALTNAAKEQLIKLKRLKPGEEIADVSKKKLSVVISAEQGVKHGLVVTCIDSARSQGIERFAIAVDRKLVNTTDTPAPK